MAREPSPSPVSAPVSITWASRRAISPDLAATNSTNSTVTIFLNTIPWPSQPPIITSLSQAILTVGTAGTFRVSANSYLPVTFSQSGALPTGVTLSPAGILSGRPALGTVVRVIGEDRSIGNAGELPRGRFTLTNVNLFGKSVSDAGLANLKGLAGLKVLVLYNTKLSDAGLAHVKDLTSLTTLDLGQTKVTDAGLDGIKPLKGLTTLSLHYTAVSEAWLENLKDFNDLAELNINGAVTDAGLARIAKCRTLKDKPAIRADHGRWAGRPEGPSGADSTRRSKNQMHRAGTGGFSRRRPGMQDRVRRRRHRGETVTIRKK